VLDQVQPSLKNLAALGNAASGTRLAGPGSPALPGLRHTVPSQGSPSGARKKGAGRPMIAFVPGYRPVSTAKFVSAGSGRDKTASLNRALAGTRAKSPGEKALTSEFSR
jgi:hypothetical protein